MNVLVIVRLMSEHHTIIIIKSSDIHNIQNPHCKYLQYSVSCLSIFQQQKQNNYNKLPSIINRIALSRALKFAADIHEYI